MIVLVSHTTHGSALIKYCMVGKDGAGHNGNKTRNLEIGHVHMLPNSVVPYWDQMRPYWEQKSARHTYEVRHIITSYAREEIDPADPEAAEIALQAAVEMVEKFYPDRQAILFVQSDGKGGCLHVHHVINDAEMATGFGRGCTSAQTWQPTVERHYKEVAGQYIDLVDPMEPGRRRRRDRMSKQEERAIEEGKYSARSDIKERVKQAMSTATSREDFADKLVELGCSATFKKKKRKSRKEKDSKVPQEYIVYQLLDLTGFKDNLPKTASALKARSYTLGYEYSAEALDEHIKVNLNQLKEEQEKQRIKAQTKEAPRTSDEEMNRKKARLERDEDVVLQVKFNRLSGLDPYAQELSYEEHLRLAEAADLRWEAFKAAYPDYKNRLERGDIAMPQEESEEVDSGGDIGVGVTREDASIAADTSIGNAAPDQATASAVPSTAISAADQDIATPDHPSEYEQILARIRKERSADDNETYKQALFHGMLI